jgi:hypothetical protein
VLAPLRADNLTATLHKVMEHQKKRPFFFDMQAVMLRDMPYVYRYTATRIKMDKKGKVQESRTWTREMIPINGYLYSVDNGPAAVTEQDRTEKEYHKFSSVPEPVRTKREDRWERERQERRKFWDEFLKAFTFEQVRREVRDQRNTTVVRFTPRPGYRAPNVIDARFLKLIKGQLWVDDEDLEVSRLDCEFIDDVKVGGGVFGKLYKGSRYSMELRKQFDGKWWPARSVTEFSKRVVMSRSSEKLAVTFSNYRKFSTSSEIHVEAPIEKTP